MPQSLIIVIVHIIFIVAFGYYLINWPAAAVPTAA